MKHFLPILGPEKRGLRIAFVFCLTLGVVALLQHILCEGAFDAHPILRGLAGLAVPILVVILVEMRQRRAPKEQPADDAKERRD